MGRELSSCGGLTRNRSYKACRGQETRRPVGMLSVTCLPSEDVRNAKCVPNAANTETGDTVCRALETGQSRSEQVPDTRGEGSHAEEVLRSVRGSPWVSTNGRKSFLRIQEGRGVLGSKDPTTCSV